jgi:hypothetical protein
MKKIYILASLFLAFAFTSNAQLLLDENFDYGGTGGTLTTITSNWIKHSGTNIDLAYVTTSLSMASYPSSGVGGSVFVESSDNKGEDANRSFTAQTSGVVYASALVNIPSATTLENYFLHFMTGTTSFYTRLYAKDDGAGNLKLGITNSANTHSTDGSAIYSTANYSYNTTYLVVLKYDFSAGTNGTSSLFVLSAVAATEPAANAVSAGGTTAIATIDKIAIRQSLSSGAAVNSTVDGIRVANTWADLMTNPSTPTVSFASATQSANEGAGTVNVNLNISPAPAGAETVTISIVGGTATYGADYTTTPNGATSTFNVPVTAGATSASFSITINDDATPEDNETILFEISAVSAGLTIGATDALTFTIIDNDIVQIRISDVQATTGGDLSDKEGDVVTIGGRVSAIKSGTGFFIQDSPGAWNGIYIYDIGANTVTRGDSVILTGTVVEFAPAGSTEKSTQIANLTSFTKEGNYTPYAATALSTSAINAEMYEGVLVSVTNGTVNTTMNGFGEYIINDGSGNAVIDDFLYLTTPAPALGEVYNVTGVIAHNFGAYKILPRDAADVSKVLFVNENTAHTFSVYPNPSNGLVNVDIKSNVVVEVYNALGKLVLSTTDKSFELPSGFYSVRVITENGSASKSLIVE